MPDQAIPWNVERGELFQMFLKNSKIHQPANMSTINWAGAPDSLVEKMKEQNKMPGKGINNLILTSGPWEPEWFETYSQKLLPNGTQYKYFNYEALDADVQMISQEMEKVGVKGAYKAFKMLRPKAFKADIWRWMALWHYGGIYLDAKMAFAKNVSDWISF